MCSKLRFKSIKSNLISKKCTDIMVPLGSPESCIQLSSQISTSDISGILPAVENYIMDNIHRYNKEQFFFYELLKDIQEDIHYLNDKPGKVYITLTEHLNNVNARVPEKFRADELVDMEECIRDAVKDLTDLDLNTYLCTGVVVLSEYLDSPEDMFEYIGKKKRGL